jgi:hypothetical protein
MYKQPITNIIEEDDLNRLYKEKYIENASIIIEPVEKKPKKIKKKDIVVEDIETRELQYYGFDLIEPGLKIYNGVLIENKEQVLSNIEFYKQISPLDKFTELSASTLTSRGCFTNTNFNENQFITTIGIPPIEYAAILKIGCNFGEIYRFPNPYVNTDIAAIVKSIIALDNNHLKIGCSCNDPMDVVPILELINIVTTAGDKFVDIFNKYIKVQITVDRKFIKTRVTKLFKTFKNLHAFRVLNNEEVKDIYSILEYYIHDKTNLDICNTYVDRVVELVKIFTNYEASCSCSKQYQIDNNLDIDKNLLVKKVKSSTYGAKVKEKIIEKEKKKKKSTHKKQGTGLFFSSQISFEIYNPINANITKIKVFRNGNFQVPGVKNADMSDLVPVIKLLQNYLNTVAFNTTEENHIEIQYAISVMRNYTCRIVNEGLTIILNKMEEILNFEKTMPITEVPFMEYLKFIKDMDMSDKARFEVFRYFNMGFYPLSEISLNPEGYPGILVKFNRPIPGKENKKITIKILSSGKINIDGGSSEIEVFEIYYWIQYIFNKYWSEVIYDAMSLNDEVVSSDSEEGYESIYDYVD